MIVIYLWRGDHLAAFYYGACGFRPTSAGLLELS
jgi:hypothetical protein